MATDTIINGNSEYVKQKPEDLNKCPCVQNVTVGSLYAHANNQQVIVNRL